MPRHGELSLAPKPATLAEFDRGPRVPTVTSLLQTLATQAPSVVLARTARREPGSVCTPLHPAASPLAPAGSSAHGLVDMVCPTTACEPHPEAPRRGRCCSRPFPQCA